MSNKLTKKCNCKQLRHISTSGDKCFYRCMCGKTEKEITMSKESYKILYKESLKPMKIHDLYHKFCKMFQDKNREWKYYGYKFMQKVKKFAEVNKEIKLIYCDDSGFSSSFIVLIPHEDEFQLWGTAIIFIPQNFGKISELFLYPNHLKDLLENLNQIAKKTKEHGNKKLFSNWRNKKEKLPDELAGIKNSIRNN